MTTIKEALEKAHQALVLGMAFLTRDAGTARIHKTASEMADELAKAEAVISLALADIERAGKEWRTHGETWAKIADKAADAIGVTPSSDMRTHVKAAVIWALEDFAAALSPPASQGIEREKPSPAPATIDLQKVFEQTKAKHADEAKGTAAAIEAIALIFKASISRMEEREKELMELCQGVAAMTLADVNGGKENCLHNACKWDAATYVRCARNLIARKGVREMTDIVDHLLQMAGAIENQDNGLKAENTIYGRAAAEITRLRSLLAGQWCEGWKFVPIESTEKMQKDGAYQVSGVTRKGAACVWSAMIANIPDPPSVGNEKTKYIEAIRGLLMEWDKFTRYGSPIAKAANERVAAARKLLEGG